MKTPQAYALLILSYLSTANAASVRVDHGDIYYVAYSGEVSPVTTSGGNSDPALSPDGKTVVYVHHLAGGDPNQPPTEICLSRIDGSHARVVLGPRISQKPEQALGGFKALAFAPNGGMVYFLSDAWTTSSAVHALNLRSKAEHFVTPGNTLQVVPRGKYAGYLIASKHKYLDGGGSYDFYWLITPAGKDIQAIGDSQEAVDNFLSMMR